MPQGNSSKYYVLCIKGFLVLFLPILLATYYISPVYADHCTPGSPFLITHHIATYCVGNTIYTDVDNCEVDGAVHHRPRTDIECAANTAPAAAPDTAAGLKQIEDVFTNVISVIVGLGFIVTLVMLIWAGFKYLTSGGEPKAVQAAHQTVTWALLGILFLAIAWLVLKLVEAFTGVPVTGFNIRALCGPGGQWCSPSPSAGP